MVYSWTGTVKFLTIYMLAYLILSTGIYFGLKTYSRNKFSKEKLETMINAVSKFRDNTDDPCKYSIFGDPATSQGNYVKVFINCKDGKKVTNSLDLRAVEDKTLAGVLKEVGRINGFPVFFDNGNLVMGKNDISWTCDTDQKNIKDFTKQIKSAQTIECFYKEN